MKKTYLQPSVVVAQMETMMVVCGSQDITSDNGIDYGGVDEDGSKDPASRRLQRDIWEDEEENGESV
jgi:hypothetical protein